MILQLLRILLAWKRFILLSGIGCCLVAVGMAANSPPLYQSVARVQMDIASPDPVTGASISHKYADAYMGTQIELIRDYSVAGRVVDAAGFANSPDMAQQYRASVPDQTIDYRRWLAQQVIAGTGVGLIPESSVLEIQYMATSPAMATALAELTRAAYIDQTLAFQRDRALRNAEWFEQEAIDLRDRMIAAQAAKTQFERDNGVIVTRDGQSLDEIRISTQAAAAPTMVLPRARSTVPAPSAAALAEVEARLAAASRTMGPNHPALLQLREQESALREAVARETAALNVSPPAPDTPQGPSPTQIERVLRQADKINEARRLATNVSVLEEQYRATAKRAADLRLEAGSLDVGLNPVGEASRPSKPLSPNWGVVIGLSLSFGLVLGSLTALLLDLLRMPARSLEDLELEGVPVLNAQATSLAKSKSQDGHSRRTGSPERRGFFRRRKEAPADELAPERQTKSSAQHRRRLGWLTAP